MRRHYSWIILLSLLLAGCNEDIRPDVGNDSHDYGRVLLGQKIYGPAFQWRNTTKQVVDLSLPADSADAPFHQDSAFVSQNIPPNGQTPPVSVYFQPVQVGHFTTTFCVGSTSKLSFKPVTLTGEGIARQEWGDLKLGGGYLLALDPTLPFNFTPLDMGDIEPGDHREKTVNIENHGTSPTLVHMDWISPDYWWDANGNSVFTVHESMSGPEAFGVTVPAGGMRTLVIRFTPKAVGSFLLVLRFNNGQSPSTLGLGLGMSFPSPWNLPKAPPKWFNFTGEDYLVVTGKAHKGNRDH